MDAYTDACSILLLITLSALSNADMVLKRAFRKVFTSTSKITKAIPSCLKATILLLTGLDVKSCIAVKRYLNG